MLFTTWNGNTKMKVTSIIVRISRISVVLILLARKNTGEPVCYSRQRPDSRNVRINKVECKVDSENIFKKFQSEHEISVGDLLDPEFASLSTTPLPSPSITDPDPEFTSLSTTLLPSPSTTDPDCSDWSTPHPDCYILNKTKMSWYDAVTACYQYGEYAHLAFIESEIENRFILNFIEEQLREVNCAFAFFCDVWIGLNGKKQEGVWKWYDTTVQFFGNQTVTESGLILENCGRLAGFPLWEWRDADCNELYYSICEI